MNVVDGIVYSNAKEPIISICGVRPLNDYKLWVRFSTGESKEFDFSPLLNEPCFMPLRDKNIFNDVYIDYGITVWSDGDIDIDPQYLYENGITVSDCLGNKTQS